jgi:16S rRNA (uracil1498-N3)-methyltransferase
MPAKRLRLYESIRFMTRRRWIADEVSENRAALTGDHAAHLSRVLRARVGQEFDISTPTGVRRGIVAALSEDRVEFELGEEIPVVTVPQITLVLSIFKFDRMEWAIEKCTELGAARIIPVIASRTESHLAAAAPKRVERWRRVALQASEQSRRVAPLAISQPIQLEEAVAFPGILRVVLSETEQAGKLQDVIHNDAAELALAFGPEGGWTEGETRLFQSSGWVSASLGPTILRAETAAIAALAIALSQIRSG